LSRALSLAAAVSLGAVPPAVVTALVIASVLVDCSIRALLPGTFVASLVPTLLSAAFVLHMRARTRGQSVVTGLLFWGGLLALFVGSVAAIVELSFMAMIVLIPAAIVASTFGVLGLPVFVLILRYSAAPWHPLLLIAGALVPVAVFAFREAGRSCQLVS
jgi:hypothetical protein